MLNVENEKEQKDSAHGDLIKNREKGKDEAKKVEVGENENLGILIANIGVILAAFASLFSKFLLND